MIKTRPIMFGWPDEGALKRNFLPKDLAPLLKTTGYEGTIAVQAREVPEETRFLLDLAAAHPLILGVVGWLDLCADNAKAEIESYRQNKRLRGLRMLIHDQPDLNFADSPPHLRGVSLLADYGLTYDLLLRPNHLTPALRLVDKLPKQAFVIDHIAKPTITDIPDPMWLKGMQDLARRNNVYCKLSGLSTLATPDRLTVEHLKPYIESVISAFSPSRVMIGSDWPVATLGTDYNSTMGLIEAAITDLSASEQADILGLSCKRFYGV
jgi:L-fuconolactonase